jgi:hypothetical protein
MPPILPFTNMTAWLSGTSDKWEQTPPSTITHNNSFKLISQAPILSTSLAVPLAIIKNLTTYQFSELCPRIFKIFPPTVTPKKSYRVVAHATGGDSSGLRMWQEIGLCWPHLPKTDNWYARTKGKPNRLCSQWAYNAPDPPDPDPYQAGGTAVIIRKRLTPQINSHESDPSGLGRWAWIRIGNEPLRCTTFISVY